MLEALIMSKYRIGLVLTIVMLLPLHMAAQANAPSQELILQGLSDRTVKEIIKDDYGFLWIATRNGLNLYDGIHITVFDNHVDSENRISARDIAQITARENGSVVIKYETNRRFVDLLVPGEPEAKKLFLNSENGVLGVVEEIELDGFQGATYLLVEEDSMLWIQSLNSEDKFDTLFAIPSYNANPASKYQLKPISNGTFWIIDDQFGLINVDSTGSLLDTIRYDSLGLESKPGLTSIFHMDMSGRLWLAFDGAAGLWEYNNAAGMFTPFINVADDQYYNKLWEDKVGNVLLGEKGEPGISSLFLIRQTDVVEPFDQLLSFDRNINVVFSDDFERLVFLGTNGGIKKIIQSKKRVKNYLHANDDGNSNFRLRGITSGRDGTIFISTKPNQWCRIDHQADSISVINLKVDSTLDELPQFCDCSRELLYDPNGYIWGNRYSDQKKAELIRFSLRDSTFNFFQFDQKIESMVHGLDGNIWLVSGGANEESRLSYFDTKAYNFHHYYNENDQNPLAGYHATFLYESKDSLKWVGTSDGLFMIDMNKRTHALFKFSDDDYYGLSSDYILAIHEGNDGRIWIGTAGGGLNVLNQEKDVFKYFDSGDGLSDNNVCGIIEDDNGNLWLSTYNGLSFFETNLQSFRNFGVRDGFSHNEFNRYSYLKDQGTGLFYFGTLNGLNVINPNELLERNVNAPILLSTIAYYDQEEGAIVERKLNIQDLGTVDLPASNRYFECKFVLADFTYPKLNQFLYKLEGQDIDWNHLHNQNEVRFNNLPAGKYTLRIRGADRNGNISNQEFSLDLHVGDFFYRQSWFLLLCVSLILFSIYAFHRIKLQQAIKMERLRTKISSDLHDDVGGLLSGLAMQTELLELTAKDQDKPKLKRISEMSRNAMAQMRDVIWATDARKDRFEDLVLRMKEHSAEILFPKGISCYFNVKNINVDKRIPVQIRQNLYLIFKEAITNVAKHSNASRADVKLVKEGSKFEMIIADDGKYNGQNKQNGELSFSNRGSGLKNMKLRAQNINAQFDISKEEGFNISITMKSFI